MKSGISFVFFDVGQVLTSIKNGWQSLCRDYHLNEKAADLFWEVWGKYSDQICALRMTADEFNQKLAQETDFRPPPGFDITRETINRFERIQSTYDLVIQVVTKYPVGLLSNAYPGMLDDLLARDLIPNIGYQTVVDSAKVKMIKPEREIFVYAQKKAKTPAGEILLVDNSEKNVKVAHNLGWQTYQFNEAKAEKCAAELKNILLSE